MNTTDSAIEYLSQRAAIYNGSFNDILQHTPTILWDSPDELITFWEGRDISHIFPKSIYPEIAYDWTNVMPEDPDINRARGAEIMTEAEIIQAEADNEAYAEAIDVLFDNDSAEVLTDVLVAAI